MLSFTVHEPPGPFADKLERAENVVMVRDGFSWWAALATPLWLWSNRLWLPLLGYFAVLMVLALIAAVFDLNPELTGWVMIAVHLIAGFEAASIHRYVLARRGYTEIASVSGRTVDDCERRFFDDWLPQQPFVSRDAPLSAGSLGPRRQWTGRLTSWPLGRR